MTNPQNLPKPKQQRAVETREAIISAAGLLFEEKGYEGTGVKELLRAAGKSNWVFYNYFPDGKLDVAKAIMQNTLTMDGVLPTETKLQVVIDTGMVLAYRIVREPALRAALRLSFQKNAPYGTPWEAWIEINTIQLTEAQENGEVRSNIKPADQAYQIAGAWSGLVFISEALDSDLKNLEQRVSVMYRNLMLVVAERETLLDLDLSLDRGCRLYTAFLETQASAAEEAQENQTP
ncbi:TetR/AcrR family transcriptional regulator [Streptomyces sp. NPDC002817]|uniref:TetR/AcrR family transcriptional regulator n=1 Tax=Streptomyces sp. NPDC088357 TaxID=3154655 RepID=UPI003444CABF